MVKMCTSSRQYLDILAPRRQDISTFMWVSRQLHPQVAFKQLRKPSPEFHKDEVLASPKIQELLIAISRKQDVEKTLLEAQVRNILDEIGYNRKIKVIRWLGLILVKICLKVSSGIFVNEDRVIQIRETMGNCPLIFVPSHRSYADFILMCLVCFHEEITLPAIAAGMDFHGMWGMGTVLRDVGAFFMRRSYNDDDLYWTTFKQYVYQIVTKGELPIKFFIEGTRSRSNKSLHPKYGLITMILKAFFLGQVPDIMFVPINISYDRILEEKLFAFELLGIPKPKESTKGFFKSLSIVKEKFGSIYFDFGAPISAKEFFGDKLDRSVHNLGPIHQQEISEDERKLIPHLAHEIIQKQQKHCVITTFNLLAIALDNNLTNGDKLLTIEDFVREIVELKLTLETLGAFVSIQDVKKSIYEALEVHASTIKVTDQNEITLRWDSIVLDKINTNKLKAHGLSDKTITHSVPFILLQIYINPVLHYLVDVAILVRILKYYQQTASKHELFGHYQFLRYLMSQEFVTFPPRENMEFDKALEDALKLDVIVQKDGLYQLGSNEKCHEMFCVSLDCFIYCYFIVCSLLLQSSKVVDEKSVLVRIQEEVEIGINDKAVFIHPYSLSLDTITNCLNSLSSQGVLIKTRSKGQVLYEIKGNELAAVKRRLEHFIPPSQVLQRKLESVQLHLKTKL